MVMKTLDNAARAVLKVGDGRGFVVEAADDRYVITAAHCLPYFPPCNPQSYIRERVYASLLGEIGEDLTVWAECVFVDPIADIAVLGCPDGQALWEEAEGWSNLVDSAETLRVGDLAPEQQPVWLSYLDGSWHKAVASHRGKGIWLVDAARKIEGGMSGSPILVADGAAVGVLSTATSTEDHTGGGPQARLRAHLPGWWLLG